MTIRKKSLLFFSFLLSVIYGLLLSLAYLIGKAKVHPGEIISGPEAKALTSFGIAVFFLASLFFLFLYVFSRRRIITPLEKLEISARLYNTENRRFPLPRIKNDEIGSLALSIDTMIKTIEGQRRKMARDEKLSALGMLAAGMAHEINNPIGYIISNFGTLEKYLEQIGKTLSDIGGKNIEARDQIEKSDIPGALRDAADILRDNREGIYKIHGIVKRINSFSRSGFESDHSSVSLNKAAAEALDKSGIGSEKNPLVIRDMGRIPSVLANEEELFQLFMNLFLNARYAVPREEGIIRFRSWAEGKKVFCTVEDNGPGIGESEKDRIFEPFYTTKPPGEGVGLGLNISYSTMKSFGGDISAGRSEWGGARLLLTFPRGDSGEQPR